MFKLISRLIYTALSIAEGFVVLRAAMIFLNANQENAIVAFIMNTSNYLVNPFVGVLPGSISIPIFSVSLDPAIVVAFTIYLVAGFVAAELVKAFSHT